MYKKLSAKKWKFNLGGGLPTQGIDGVQNPTFDELQAQMKLYEQQMQWRTQQPNNQPNLQLNTNLNTEIIPQQTTVVDPAISTIANPVTTTMSAGTTPIPTTDSAPTMVTGGTDTTIANSTTGSPTIAGASGSLFSSQDYVKGAMAGISSLQNAKLDDGKITGDEVGSSALDAATGMAGPYGQVANAAITVGENLLGDSLYQGLGEGVEYEKGASRFGKGALKGASIGMKVGGPWGAAIGAVGGGALSLFGQGRRKRQAMEEFEKRRDERIRNMNQQSKNIYADQYQTFYKKGGKAIIKIKEANKGKFTKFCLDQGYTGVTQECIDKAKKSNSTSLKKQAVFAENVRSFKK